MCKEMKDLFKYMAHFFIMSIIYLLSAIIAEFASKYIAAVLTGLCSWLHGTGLLSYESKDFFNIIPFIAQPWYFMLASQFTLALQPLVECSLF